MDDLPVMLKIYQHARELMAANGNPTQWGNTFPREEVILDDIRQQRTMLLVDEADGKERVLAQFALCTGEDPTYAHIDGPVGAFHRIIAGLRGLSDDVVVTGQGGERHELGGTVMHAHMGMRLRLVMRQIDDVVVAMGFRKAHAA